MNNDGYSQHGIICCTCSVSPMCNLDTAALLLILAKVRLQDEGPLLGLRFSAFLKMTQVGNHEGKRQKVGPGGVPYIIYI